MEPSAVLDRVGVTYPTNSNAAFGLDALGSRTSAAGAGAGGDLTVDGTAVGSGSWDALADGPSGSLRYGGTLGASSPDRPRDRHRRTISSVSTRQHSPRLRRMKMRRAYPLVLLAVLDTYYTLSALLSTPSSAGNSDSHARIPSAMLLSLLRAGVIAAIGLNTHWRKGGWYVVSVVGLTIGQSVWEACSGLMRRGRNGHGHGDGDGEEALVGQVDKAFLIISAAFAILEYLTYLILLRLSPPPAIPLSLRLPTAASAHHTPSSIRHASGRNTPGPLTPFTRGRHSRHVSKATLRSTRSARSYNLGSPGVGVRVGVGLGIGGASAGIDHDEDVFTSSARPQGKSWSRGSGTAQPNAQRSVDHLYPGPSSGSQAGSPPETYLQPGSSRVGVRQRDRDDQSGHATRPERYDTMSGATEPDHGEYSDENGDYENDDHYGSDYDYDYDYDHDYDYGYEYESHSDTDDDGRYQTYPMDGNHLSPYGPHARPSYFRQNSDNNTFDRETSAAAAAQSAFGQSFHSSPEVTYAGAASTDPVTGTDGSGNENLITGMAFEDGDGEGDEFDDDNDNDDDYDASSISSSSIIDLPPPLSPAPLTVHRMIPRSISLSHRLASAAAGASVEGTPIMGIVRRTKSGILGLGRSWGAEGAATHRGVGVGVELEREHGQGPRRPARIGHDHVDLEDAEARGGYGTFGGRATGEGSSRHEV